MKTTYIFLDRSTGQLISQEGCNEYVARLVNPAINICCVLYQTIVESNDYIRTITYKTTNCYWHEILHIEHINKK